MRKSKKIGLVSLASGFVLLGAVGFHKYNDINMLYEQLSGTAGYFQVFNDSAEQALPALNYTYDTLNILGSKDSNIPANELADLKNEVRAIEKEIESSQTNVPPSQPPYVPDEILVIFKPDVGKADQDQLLQELWQEYGLNKTDAIPQINEIVLKVDQKTLDTMTLDEIIKAVLQKYSKVVEIAEKNPTGQIIDSVDYIPEVNSLGEEMKVFVDRNSQKSVKHWLLAAWSGIAGAASCFGYSVYDYFYKEARKRRNAR